MINATGVENTEAMDELPKKKIKSSMVRSLQVENLLPQNMCGQLSTTCSNLLKQQPNEEFFFANNQLRTMASEKIDPIDWSHPPP